MVVVACSLSSMTQCPVLGKMTDAAFVATSFTCFASAPPFAISPPIERTGIFSFVRDSCAKSFAACGNDTKYAHAERMRPGRAYAAAYARPSASGIDRVRSAAKSFRNARNSALTS